MALKQQEAQYIIREMALKNELKDEKLSCDQLKNDKNLMEHDLQELLNHENNLEVKNQLFQKELDKYIKIAEENENLKI